MGKGKQEIFGMVPVRLLSKTTHNELIALCTISSFQGGNDYAFPSLDVLAERSGISKQAFSKATTGLFKKGFIHRKKRYGSTNIYFVVWHIEDLDSIKESNKKAKKHKFKQSSDSIGYLNKSDADDTNKSDADGHIESDDILKEQLKEQVKISESGSEKIQSLPSKIQELASKNNIEYSQSLRDDNNFIGHIQGKIANATNERIYEQAEKFVWLWNNCKPRPAFMNKRLFGFKQLCFSWDEIEAEYNARKPKTNVLKFERAEMIDDNKIENFMRSFNG